MWKKKRLAVIGVILAVAVLAGVAGVALAQTTTDNGTTVAGTFAGKVAAILGIDQQQVEDAFSQARQEMADEAIDKRLDSMVEAGKITQEQADEYKSWWQERPDDVLPGMGFGMRMGGMRFGKGMLCQPGTTIPAE